MRFPLRFVPILSYKTMGRKFGAPRDNGKRKHAGCDLIAPLGTEIFAIDGGVVDQSSKGFYHGTNSIVIRHHCGLTIRYCEVLAPGPGKETIRLARGEVVAAGQLIAHVGKMLHDSMLHFEVYRGNVAGALTQRGSGGFQRRADLIDGTPLLNQLSSLLSSQSATAGQR